MKERVYPLAIGNVRYAKRCLGILHHVALIQIFMISTCCIMPRAIQSG